ncbi:MAG: hypothetical protein IJ600_06635, partial [Lachnospiraceae bacterium]|nr:hypothetical protein [Lachnospiraceae bacterium]
MIAAVLLLLGGCAEYEDADPTKNSIIVHRDQSLEAVMLRTFDQAYYSEEELVAMIGEELEKYNAEHGTDAISLKKHSLTGQELQLTLQFQSWEDYDRYML